MGGTCQAGMVIWVLAAGLVPPVLAVLTVLVARLPADEIAHPLDVAPAVLPGLPDGQWFDRV